MSVEYFHESFTKCKIPKLKSLIQKLDRHPNIEDTTRLAELINDIYSLYFWFFRKTMDAEVDEISSFSLNDKIIHTFIIRDGSRTPRTIRFESEALAEAVQIISPPGVLDLLGFAVSYDEIKNDRKERERAP